MLHAQIRKKNRINSGSRFADVVIYLVLILLSILFIYPLYQVIVCSISDANIVMKTNSLLLWPQGIHFNAYKVVLQNKSIWNAFKNTLVYLVTGTSLQYFVTLITAYPLSIKNLPLKKGILIFFTITMYFSGGIIPIYMLNNKLGLMNSMWVLILPCMMNTYNMIIMRTHFVNIPEELKEAATIDGVGDGRMLFSILLPLSGAVSAVLILFTAVGYWNMWYEPMIYFTKRSLYPIQSVLREILIDNTSSVNPASANTFAEMNSRQGDTNMLVKYANIVVTTLPILCIYPFAQKYFVKGVMVGSLKG